MTSQHPLVRLATSARPAPPGQLVGDVPEDDVIHASVYLRFDPDGSSPAAGSADRRHEAAFSSLSAFAAEHGLMVQAFEPRRHLVRLGGRCGQMQKAFDMRLRHYEADGRRFRGREGHLSLPAPLHDVVQSVLGLDTRPMARRGTLKPQDASAKTGVPPRPGVPARQIARYYGLPDNLTGVGQTVALLEFGGGFLASDNALAFADLPVKPTVSVVPIDDAVNDPEGPYGEGEVSLDIQVVASVAPASKIAVYFAHNTEAGFADAISAAVSRDDDVSVISISWGCAEASWSRQAIETIDAHLAEAVRKDKTVFCSSGDRLATDGRRDAKAHVHFPASSPWVVACGGTALNVSDGVIVSEDVWNDGQAGGGGGISDVFDVPSFQGSAGLPASVNGGRAGRGVPDIAACASPHLGYLVITSGTAHAGGGTSAVAPLFAAVTALANQRAGRRVGFITPKLYRRTDIFRGVNAGTNMPRGSLVGYRSTGGWNCCVGLGSPQIEKFIDVVTATIATDQIALA